MLKAVILGAPASGKGTISSRIVNCFGVTHLSSGDLIRKQIRDGTELGNQASQIVSEGKFVPDKLIMRLVMSELKLLGGTPWLLDGFPRTRYQGEELFKQFKLDVAIALDVPVEEIVNRVKGRWVHFPSGRVYNETFNKPKVPRVDDVTGEPLQQRPDDAPAAVRQRLELYNDSVKSLLELYREHSILHTFHGRTSDEIWPKVRDLLLKYVPKKV